MEMTPPPAGFNSAAMGGDRIRLLAAGTLVAELDGRYWTAETCASFTGRVIGLYASAGNGQLRRLPVPGHRGMMDGIGFGAAYYAEYQHRPDIEADFEPDGQGRLLHDPGGRVGLVDLGTGGRTV